VKSSPGTRLEVTRVMCATVMHIALQANVSDMQFKPGYVCCFIVTTDFEKEMSCALIILKVVNINIPKTDVSGFTLTKFIPADSTMWDNPEFPISVLLPGQQSKTIKVMRVPKTIVCKGLFTSMYVHLAVVFVCPHKLCCTCRSSPNRYANKLHIYCMLLYKKYNRLNCINGDVGIS